MPNWCSNIVELDANPEQIRELANVLGSEDNQGFINFLLPMPPEVQATNDDWMNANRNDPNDWYNWQVENWGIKWGDSDTVYSLDDQNPRRMTLHFTTPWAPPTEAYKKMEELGFSVLAYWCEYGMMFCGKYEFGEVEDYEIGEHSDELDAAFEINDTIAENEASY